jgi:hypothetical protein
MPGWAFVIPECEQSERTRDLETMARGSGFTMNVVPANAGTHKHSRRFGEK